MHFNSVLISSFFASAVLAAPSRLSVDTVLADSNTAGKILSLASGHGTIQFVTSTINAPDISSQEAGTSAIAYVGIDGDGACPAMLQLGLEFTAVAQETSYQVIYRYGNGYNGFINDVSIDPGNPIKLTVDAPVGAKLAIVEILNLNNNQTNTQKIPLSDNLCGKTAEWIVENLTNKPIKFGTLEFTSAVVGGNDFGPQNLNTDFVEFSENGTPLTSVSTDGDSITVKNT